MEGRWISPQFKLLHHSEVELRCLTLFSWLGREGREEDGLGGNGCILILGMEYVIDACFSGMCE
jgi:hypothetical protein